MDRRLLDILCCPATRQPLAPLASRELAAINDAIRAGSLRRADGGLLSDVLSAGLLTRDRKLVYRIEDGIPVLLAEEAISTSQVTDFPG